MGKHVFLIDNEISRIAQIECLIAGTQITFSTAHNERTASPMLYSEEIDLVAMSGSVSGSAPLLNKLLDLKYAKGTLLLLRKYSDDTVSEIPETIRQHPERLSQSHHATSVPLS